MPETAHGQLRSVDPTHSFPILQSVIMVVVCEHHLDSRRRTTIQNPPPFPPCGGFRPIVETAAGNQKSGFLNRRHILVVLIKSYRGEMPRIWVANIFTSLSGAGSFSPALPERTRSSLHNLGWAIGTCVCVTELTYSVSSQNRQYREVLQFRPGRI